LLWALKPADDGLESGLVARVWNLSGRVESHSLSFEGGIAEALALTHIETPTGIASVEDGRLVDLINGQQMKTYAIFPSALPYRPDTSGLERATATPPAAVPSATAPIEETSAPAPVTNTPPPPSFTQTVEPVEPSGKGCLFGVLYVLGLLK
jgi:hypothetical protein